MRLPFGPSERYTFSLLPTFSTVIGSISRAQTVSSSYGSNSPNHEAEMASFAACSWFAASACALASARAFASSRTALSSLSIMRWVAASPRPVCSRPFAFW